MPNAVVLMTALVPTLGHKYLIDFAEKLVSYDGGVVHVILGSLPKEPVEGSVRLNSFKQHYRNHPAVKIHHLHRDVPQDPSEHPDFWKVWRDIVREFVDVQPTDFFVASELYGMDMAEVLGCKFMPCNRYREVLPVKGTTVRQDMLNNFDSILPEFQPHVMKTVTVFGAESCGKTTMTKALASKMNGWFIPEWAREYLETVGAELTDRKMNDIVMGQFATQMTANRTLRGKPWIFQDTDLLSTIGYYRLWGGDKRRDMHSLIHMFVVTKSDLYIMMNTSIPFEQDPLRYGGDKRESDMSFWINLMDEFKCNYIIAPAADHQTQLAWAQDQLLKFYRDKTKHISEYVR